MMCLLRYVQNIQMRLSAYTFLCNNTERVLIMNKTSKKKITAYTVFILIAEAVGVLSGLITRGGIEAYGALDKPAFTPPAIVFPIVWTVLFALMGIGAARVYLTDPSSERTWGLGAFFIQLIVNFFWSIFFFNRQAFTFAFVWLLILLALVVIMTWLFSKSDKAAAYLQIPYIVWLIFAAVLNASVAAMN